MGGVESVSEQTVFEFMMIYERS